jgi:phosphotransferase system  glucose/maltose/N-acetylglucosamine-specific IIC component
MYESECQQHLESISARSTASSTDRQVKCTTTPGTHTHDHHYGTYMQPSAILMMMALGAAFMAASISLNASELLPSSLGV